MKSKAIVFIMLFCAGMLLGGNAGCDITSSTPTVVTGSGGGGGGGGC